MSFNPPPTMPEDLYSQFLHDFPVSPNPQGNTADTEGHLDDYTNSNLFNGSFQTSMAPPVPSSLQSRSLLSLPQPNFNRLSYPITATSGQQFFNHNNFFTPNSTPAQKTWTMNEHNVPNDFRALIQPHAPIAESCAEDTPGRSSATPNRLHNPASHSSLMGPGQPGQYIQPQALFTERRGENSLECSTGSTKLNHFHNPISSSALGRPGQPGHSGWVARSSSSPVTHPGGGGISLIEHQYVHTQTQNMDVVPETINIKETQIENVNPSTSPVRLPSNRPVSNRPDLPYVICCIPDCYKIYQGMDAFTAHIRSEETAPDPGHNIKTSNSSSQAVKCPWNGCEKSLIPSSLYRHMEVHALIDWKCAVPGCRSSLSSKNRALTHFTGDHDDLRGEYPMDCDRVYEIPAKHRRNP